MRLNFQFLIFSFFVAVLSGFVFFNAIEEYELSSYYIFSVFGSVFILTGIRYLRKKSKNLGSLNLDIIDVAFLIYVFYTTIHSLVIFNKIQDPVFVWLVLISTYFILKYVINSRHKDALIKALLLTGLIQSFFVFFQIGGIIDNLDSNYLFGGTFGNPNVLAIYLVLLIPLCIQLFLNKSESFVLRGVVLLLSAIFIFVIVISECRSALIGLAIIVFTFILFYSSKKIQRLAVIIFFGALIPASFFLYQFKKDSTDGRLLIWKVSANAIADNPILGRGYGSFEKVYNNYQSKYFEKKGNDIEEAGLSGHIKSGFNEFIEEWMEGGIIGLILLASIFIVFIISIGEPLTKDRKSASSTIVTAISGIICFLFISFVNFTLNILSVSILFIFYLSLISNKNRLFDLPIRFGKIGYAIITVFLIFVFIDRIKEGYFQLKYKEAKKNLAEGNKTRAGKLFKECYPHLNQYGRFLYDYSSYYAKNGNYYKSLELLEEARNYSSHYQLYTALGKNQEFLKEYSKAENYHLKAINMVPSKMEPRFHLFLFYRKVGDNMSAKKIAIELKSMEMRIPSEKAIYIKEQINEFLTKHRDYENRTNLTGANSNAIYKSGIGTRN